MRKIVGLCSIEGCNKNHFSKGFCVNHYARVKAKGLVGPASICSVAECSLPAYAKGLCGPHYQKLKRGSPLTKFKINEFKVSGKICTIKILNEDSSLKHTTIVDAEDYEKVKGHRWSSSMTSCGVWYVRTTIKRKAVSLHHFVSGSPSLGFEMDHRNRDTFDNRKENHRICTRAQNVCNVEKYSGKSSQYKGVSFHKQCEKWVSSITRNGEFTYLGLFRKEIDAALAYNEAAERLHGEFAYLNDVGD